MNCRGTGKPSDRKDPSFLNRSLHDNPAGIIGFCHWFYGFIMQAVFIKRCSGVLNKQKMRGMLLW
jgi:hypothetical protein